VGPVLVLRALGLGDALTGVPALRGLRRRYADRPLLLAGPDVVSGWLCRLGLVDDVVPAAGLSDPPIGRSLGRHVAVNLHGRGPQSHKLLLAGKPEVMIAFDCPAAGHRSRSVWRRDEHEVHRWCRLVNDAGGPCSPADLRLGPGAVAVPESRSGPVVVHPGAASAGRQWPPDRWAAVIAELTADGHQVTLTGSSAESALCAHVSSLAPGCVDASGRLRLDDLAALVADARLLLSGDTGVAHLATAYGTPSVTLFGPTPPTWWGPAIDQDIHAVLYRGHRPGDPHAAHPDPSLLAITTPTVLTTARSLLTRHP
jgi:ADP-heptose:LPS heptosyltransferase